MWFSFIPFFQALFSALYNIRDWIRTGFELFPTLWKGAILEENKLFNLKCQKHVLTIFFFFLVFWNLISLIFYSFGLVK